MSSAAVDTTVDLDRIVDREFVGDVGLPHSAELLAFTNAAHTGVPDLDSARQALRDSVGDDGVAEAAATIAVFNGLVRVADGTGIRLDDGLNAFSSNDRAALGINAFAGAANSPQLANASGTVGSIGDLFG